MKQIINHTVLMWGKIRRMCIIYLTPRRTQEMLSQREGECQRCGACCKINFECPFLTNHTQAAACKLYDSRSKVCRYFPIDKRDIKDRNIVFPGTKCGYSFREKQ
ncbi:MAG: YkgJ family cysteine cluster protein [Planctomycetes bacterium]|nr:YkgJ family cysteine cluster protein [Planctomycetota bacterium]